MHFSGGGIHFEGVTSRLIVELSPGIHEIDRLHVDFQSRFKLHFFNVFYL